MILNPNFKMSFSVPMAVLRSYFFSSSGRTSYGTRHGCVFDSSFRTLPYVQPCLIRVSAHTSCTFFDICSTNCSNSAGNLTSLVSIGCGIYFVSFMLMHLNRLDTFLSVFVLFQVILFSFFMCKLAVFETFASGIYEFLQGRILPNAYSLVIGC